MTDRINGVSGTVVTPAERAPGRGKEANAGGDARAPASTDGVRLTPIAHEIQAATEAMAAAPATDAGRIAAVKLELERGEYRADSGAIADQLLRMEDQI